MDSEMPGGQVSALPIAVARHYGAPMTARWRRDGVNAQQVLLPQVAGLLLVAAILSAAVAPFPFGLILCLVALTLLALLLRRNSLRRRQGIDGWPNTLILAPFVFMTTAVLIATFVSELMAGVFVIAFFVGGSFLLIRRLRRSDEPERSAHHFRGTDSPGRF